MEVALAVAASVTLDGFSEDLNDLAVQDSVKLAIANSLKDKLPFVDKDDITITGWSTDPGPPPKTTIEFTVDVTGANGEQVQTGQGIAIQSSGDPMQTCSILGGSSERTRNALRGPP